MPVLGYAIAAHLSKLSGQYSVELPGSLLEEMNDLVAVCNRKANMANYALLITNEPPAYADVMTAPWTDMLKWRTDDNRIFVWSRGGREPESSFRSVVRPFISSHFPGDNGGECTLGQFARLSIEELWQRRGFSRGSVSFDAFFQTLKWVADVLLHSFEQVGSVSGVHWSDRFLKHWAEMLNYLDQGLTHLGQVPLTRHAWEIIRVAGLPIPSGIIDNGNSLLAQPKELEEKYRSSFANEWQTLVDEFLRTKGDIAVFLTALDDQVLGAGNTTPWRGLAWDAISSLPLDAPAPVLGKAVFTAPSSPTLLSTQVPSSPAQVPSWWGVTERQIREAAEQLRKEINLQPGPTCTSFISAFSSRATWYLLDTRGGTINSASTPKKWRARVEIRDLEVIYRGQWKNLTVSPVRPSMADESDAWIDPDSVKLSFRSSELEIPHPYKQVVVTSANRLTISFDAAITYVADLDSASNTATGHWNARRSLRLNVEVFYYLNGEWIKRPVESMMRVVVPSPFSPTILIEKEGEVLFAPDRDDSFTTNLDTDDTWNPGSTPDITLKEEGMYNMRAYTGYLDPRSPQFASLQPLYVNGLSLGENTTTSCNLDSGDTITMDRLGRSNTIVVVKVKERPGSLSSGLLSAIRGQPAKKGRPSTEARQSLLGQFQDNVMYTLCNRSDTIPHSLYQYVVSSTESIVAWPIHRGTPSPEFMFDLQGIALPGIGNGPSSELIDCPEWHAFMKALADVCLVLGLKPEMSEAWLSGFDPSSLPATTIKTYVEAQRDLVHAAKSLHHAADVFWASYPFSIVIVDGKPSASLGQLLAVLLSPLHPVRLAWAFSVAVTARQGKIDRGLLGLAEGWNIPYTGRSVSLAGQPIQLIAIPTDPGPGQDFAAWSALAVLSTHAGLAELPPCAAGLPLPWGGQTGINDKVVERAITDYLAVHPHLNSLEVDIRSVSSAPRSQEIDEAVLQFLGARTLQEVQKLGGNMRVWDSAYRLGTTPTRDKLFIIRDEHKRTSEYGGSFEWRTYEPPALPREADIALIENSSVHLAITPGTTHGIIGVLPLRRFCPPTLDTMKLDQNYFVAPGSDLLGVADLLAEIEYQGEYSYPALSATPQAHGLGIGMGARWEVLGTFNLDPSLLASVVTAGAQASGERLVWEWRPAWLAQEQNEQGELARRPYYVVAKVPRSLQRVLQSTRNQDEGFPMEMLIELGYRGIGLASLQAAGGTQGSAAAGFFYALRLLLSSGNNWVADGASTVLTVVPVDPITSLLAGLTGERLGQHADLLVIRVVRSANGPTDLCFVPVEVKHHGQANKPEPLPDNTHPELQRARRQLSSTIEVVEKTAKAVSPVQDKAEDILACYIRRVGLAALLDLALSLSPNPPAATTRADILQDVLDGQVAIGVGHPILFWFAPGSFSATGKTCQVNPLGNSSSFSHPIQELFIDPEATPELWSKGRLLGPDAQFTRDRVDEVLREALSACHARVDIAITDIRQSLERLLHLDTPPSLHEERKADADEYSPNSDGEETSKEAAADSNQENSSSETANHLSEVPRGQRDERPISAESDGERLLERDVPNQEDHNDKEDIHLQEPLSIPKALVGWTAPTSRWTVIGKLNGIDENVALDLDHPKTVGVFGYMGSGKSYLLGTLLEGAVEPIAGINQLPTPLSVVVFNYRRNASDRFELGSLGLPNHDETDVKRLLNEYGARPRQVHDAYVLALPGELLPGRLQEYGKLRSSELFFNPATLSAEDWELLMGEHESSAVFARTIHHVLVELRASGDITLQQLEDRVLSMLGKQSRAAAQLRFDFVRRYLSPSQGVDFGKILKPGRVVIVDLRQPLFKKDDAMRFFLICANQVSQVQGRFNKLIIFDEAHEYLSDEFSDKIETRIRQMRHEGTSYIFATQDVGSIPLAISRFITTKFVFSLGTRQNVDDLVRFASEFKNHQLLGMQPGHCLVQANQSVNNLFERPRLVQVRPRVTQHGGASRIFSQATLWEQEENR